MPIYDFSCEVYGYTDGEIVARNKKEAEEKAKTEVEIDGLNIAGKIFIERRPKEQDNE